MRKLTGYEMNEDKVKWNIVDDDEINWETSFYSKLLAKNGLVCLVSLHCSHFFLPLLPFSKFIKVNA